jgi:hypothetical protein
MEEVGKRSYEQGDCGSEFGQGTCSPYRVGRNHADQPDPYIITVSLSCLQARASH